MSSNKLKLLIYLIAGELNLKHNEGEFKGRESGRGVTDKGVMIGLG